MFLSKTKAYRSTVSILYHQVDLDRSRILLPEVVLRPNEAGDFERRINISVLGGKPVAFQIQTLHLVRATNLKRASIRLG